MNSRLAAIIWMLVIAAAAFGLYMVKYRVQAIQNEIAQLGKQIEEERESLHVVAAEWAYLNRPDRLQALAEKHLKLQPVNPKQLSDINAIPYANASVAQNTLPTSAIIPASATLPSGGE